MHRNHIIRYDILFNTIQCSAMLCSTIQGSTVQCNAVVQYCTLKYNKYSTVHYITAQYSIIQYSIVQHSTALHCTAQHSTTTQYYIIQIRYFGECKMKFICTLKIHIAIGVAEWNIYFKQEFPLLLIWIIEVTFAKFMLWRSY